MDRNNNDNNKLVKILVPLLLFITVAAVGVTIWAVFLRDNDPPVVLAPDYAPVETDPNAEDIPNDSTEGREENEEGAGSVSLTYSNQVTVTLSNAKASLMFANPGRANQDMVVQVVIQDLVILQSGTLNPGKMVTALDLLDGMTKRLTAGIYEGKFNILFYDPVTGEKAVVNTEIPITVTVKE